MLADRDVPATSGICFTCSVERRCLAIGRICGGWVAGVWCAAMIHHGRQFYRKLICTGRRQHIFVSALKSLYESRPSTRRRTSSALPDQPVHIVRRRKPFWYFLSLLRTCHNLATSYAVQNRTVAFKNLYSNPFTRFAHSHVLFPLKKDRRDPNLVEFLKCRHDTHVFQNLLELFRCVGLDRIEHLCVKQPSGLETVTTRSRGYYGIPGNM